MNDEVVDGRSRVTDVGDDCTAVGTAVELAYDKPSTEIVTPTIYDKSFLPKRHESAAYGVFLTPTRYPRVRSFFEADPTSQRWFYDDLRRAVSAAEDRHTEDRVRKFFGTITLEITTLPMFDLTYRPIEEIRGVRMIVHAKNGNTVPSDLGNFYRSPTLRCLFDANPLDFLDRHCGTQPSSISIAAAVQTTDLRLSRGAFQQALPAIEDRQPDPISAEQSKSVPTCI